MELFLDSVSWICLVIGSLFAVIGGIGVIRLPDFYARMHGAGITDTMGAGLILIGLMFQGGASLVTGSQSSVESASRADIASESSPVESKKEEVLRASLVTAKLVMILFFLLITSPTSSHALARSALHHGLEPLVSEREVGS